MKNIDLYEIVSEVLTPWCNTPFQCWTGIYQLLLWYEHGVPHIIESNELKKPAWRARANLIDGALAEAYSCHPHEVPGRVGRLFAHPAYHEVQKQNPLGIAFASSLVYILRKFSASDYEFIARAKVGSTVFRHVKQPPRGHVDIAVVRNGREFAVISTKWSLRHGRIRSWLAECEFYKTQMHLPYYFVVTNEFGPARLKKILHNQCKNGLFHVNRALLLEVHSGNGRLSGIEDLTDLFPHFQ